MEEEDGMIHQLEMVQDDINMPIALKTCPRSLRDKYFKMARRAESGSRAAAMKLKCLECCAWSQTVVNQCEIKTCSLWGFRSAEKKK